MLNVAGLNTKGPSDVFVPHVGGEWLGRFQRVPAQKLDSFPDVRGISHLLASDELLHLVWLDQKDYKTYTDGDVPTGPHCTGDFVAVTPIDSFEGRTHSGSPWVNSATSENKVVRCPYSLYFLQSRAGKS